MPNITSNLTADIVLSLGIVTLACIAISQPISRVKSAKKSLRAAHLFGARQKKLDQIIGGQK